MNKNLLRKDLSEWEACSQQEEQIDTFFFSFISQYLTKKPFSVKKPGWFKAQFYTIYRQASL